MLNIFNHFSLIKSRCFDFFAICKGIAIKSMPRNSAADITSFAVVFECERFAVGTFAHCRICFMCSHFDAVESTVVGFTVVMFALFYGTFDIMIGCFVFHDFQSSLNIVAERPIILFPHLFLTIHFLMSFFR